MACSPLEYAVCWKCGKPSRFDNPHNSNIFFIDGVCYFFLLRVKVLWNSWKCFIEGYLLQCTAILWSSSHRRKTQMYKLCRQKSVKLLRGNSLTVVWKAGSGSSLLRPVTRKHWSHHSLLKIQSGPTQKWCYSNTPIISARCKLLCCKEWRCLRQVSSFVEQGRRSVVKETAQAQTRGWQSEYFHQDPKCSSQSFSERQSLLGYREMCPES